MKFTLASALLIFAPAAAAQSASTDLARLSIAAGYKAAFTCSNMFNAGRTAEASDADDLARVYPDLRDAIAGLPEAVVDRTSNSASVAFAADQPPRVARWRPWLGCVQAPSGGERTGASPLRKPPDLRRAAWPRGDRITRPILAETKQGAALAAVVAAAFDARSYGVGTETSAALVVRDGAIVAERYRKGFDLYTSQRTWSVAKSIWATVIGAAVEDGILRTEDKAGLAQWSGQIDPRREITVDNLMRMASGLDSSPSGNRTDDVYFGGGRIVDHATTRRLVSKPGARFVYANNDTMILARALRERLMLQGDDAHLRYPIEKLLIPLGMTHTAMETDWNDDFVAASQVWTTARDLARLGLLYLDGGSWEGRRILPEDWRSYVTEPSGPQPSQGPGYGAQFWLYGEKQGLPPGTFAAQGNRGQYLVIIPARNILVIRRGFDAVGDGAAFDIAAFTRDVLAAIQ
ncbi:MAG: beta-lactamase family protein [Parvularculaceae bacterium]|nr:beta-lactamase family protein [Parvularculaceae bacterium]